MYADSKSTPAVITLGVELKTSNVVYAHDLPNVRRAFIALTWRTEPRDEVCIE